MLQVISYLVSSLKRYGSRIGMAGQNGKTEAAQQSNGPFAAFKTIEGVGEMSHGTLEA